MDPPVLFQVNSECSASKRSNCRNYGHLGGLFQIPPDSYGNAVPGCFQAGRVQAPPA